MIRQTGGGEGDGVEAGRQAGKEAGAVSLPNADKHGRITAQNGGIDGVDSVRDE